MGGSVSIRGQWSWSVVRSPFSVLSVLRSVSPKKDSECRMSCECSEAKKRKPSRLIPTNYLYKASQFTILQLHFLFPPKNNPILHLSFIMTTHVLGSLKIYRMVNVVITVGSLNLIICYLWARHLGHLEGPYCDISDLNRHLPERVLFRVNFGFVGAFLAYMSFPMYSMLSERTRQRNSGRYECIVKVAAVLQFLSGFGVTLVGSCGFSENKGVHLFGASLGFFGSAVAQLLYTIAIYERGKDGASVMLFRGRVGICVLFALTASLCALGNMKYIADPWRHIYEWSMWFELMAWYSLLRFDFGEFGVASVVEGKVGYDIEEVCIEEIGLMS